MKKIARDYANSYLYQSDKVLDLKKALLNPQHVFMTGFLIGTQYILDEVNFNETKIQDKSKDQPRRNKGIQKSGE
jgi:hypothetical protein